MEIRRLTATVVLNRNLIFITVILENSNVNTKIHISFTIFNTQEA